MLRKVPKNPFFIDSKNEIFLYGPLKFISVLPYFITVFPQTLFKSTLLFNILKLDSDLSMIVQGLDTSQARDVSLNAVYNTSTDGIIPRFSIDMVYDLGESVELIDIRQVSHVEKIRTDIVMFGVPRSAEISASIGDVLIVDLFVPIEYRLSSNSIDSLFLQQLRY